MQSNQRLKSLDFFRGVTMLLLMAESTGLYWALIQAPAQGTVFETIFQQFHHHPWHGLRFWDLIQPFFMFIVGVAMPFSYQSRINKGQTKNQITRHIFQRAALLLLFGVVLHCSYSGKLVWELWNVLSQLSVTIIIAYFLMKHPIKIQLSISIVLLLGMDLTYRYFSIDGFNQPFVMDHNFGSWMDMILMRKLNNGGGWVAINCIPTAAHTIWGMMVGQLLLSRQSNANKLRDMFLAGFLALLVGYLLNWLDITPIIKRIATSSFVLVSGGWALLVLAVCYWWIDIKNRHKGIWLFTLVGANSIFIYLLVETVGYQWINHFVSIFTVGMLDWTGFPAYFLAIVTSLTILSLEWGICWWLFQKKIFFKI